MKDNHSPDEKIYRKRALGPMVRSSLGSFPVVIITGARQVGKSTFLEHEFSDFPYVSLDDFALLDQARRDPASLWSGLEGLVIDEVQKAPEVLAAIKLEVDRRGSRKKFILSGSSNLLLMSRIAESLAGRAAYFEMTPFSLGELAGEGGGAGNLERLLKGEFPQKDAELKRKDPLPFMREGFFPPMLRMRGAEQELLWYESYVRTYLERDLRDLARIDSLADFRRLLGALAVRTGNILNQTSVSREIGVSQPTVNRYIRLLEVSCIAERVPAFTASRAKRVTKSPKFFFLEPGLSVFLAGYNDLASLKEARELGSFFEAMVWQQLKASSSSLVPRPGIFYWRTTTGKEVDFVLEWGRKVLPIEVKLTSRPNLGDAANLLAFLEDNPRAGQGLLLHSGTSLRYLHSRILAAPWWWPFTAVA